MAKNKTENTKVELAGVLSFERNAYDAQTGHQTRRASGHL